MMTPLFKDRRIWRAAAAVFLMSAAIGMAARSSGATVDAPRHLVKTFHDCESLETIRHAVAANDSGRQWRTLSPQEQKQRLKEWQSLSPKQRRNLRDRMDRLKQMSDADRQLYERRFRQWKQLPREERRQLLQKFDRWESLSPEERNEIRKWFRDDQPNR